MLSLIVVFPLVGFLVNGLWYALFQMSKNQRPVRAVFPGIIATAAMAASFVTSLAAWLELSGMDPHHRVIELVCFEWMKVGKFSLDFALRLDPLSALFLLVITGVGTLIHMYSIGYMADDETPGKYFAYLNLFCFAMLVLVLGASLPVLFLGWEGVGLCSYLLIGYWYADEEKATAGKKAFIVNRIGDLGFLLGMFLIFSTFGTLDFVQLKSAVLSVGTPFPAALVPTVTAIALFLFVGCAGKSAQIPLYVWLPDAMAGPTPVSALIHAATMVTSGVYLISRLNFIYSLAPDALAVVAWVGAATALFAATMAVVQTDIKKVLAYSTVSQLGYMFLGCGVAAYDAGVFHVITHAFFKALLFLGAGSVIYGMHHEQDILKMGGLRAKMPVTFKVFAVGWLAICGVAPLSGFFSKDEILWKAWSSPHGSAALWAVGAVTAVLTAFYMTRLFSLTFLGEHRQGNHGHDHAHGSHDSAHGHSHEVHESPWVMTGPLIVLAVLSAVGGWIGIPHLSWLEHWLEPVLGDHGHPVSTSSAWVEWALMAVSFSGALLGIYFGLRLYRNLKAAEALKARFSGLHKLLTHKWYVDEGYDMVFVTPIVQLSKALWKYFDVAVIDRFVNGLGRVSYWTGSSLRGMQTGSIQVYAWIFLAGLILSSGYLIFGTHLLGVIHGIR